MSTDHHDQDPTLAPFATGSTTTLPREIGGYRVFALLGAGGMGIVYEAEQPSPQRRVALKVLRTAAGEDELQLKLFEREVATLARLHHPNIAAIYESGRTDDGRQFFAMELVRGQTLAQWLATRPDRPDRDELELRLRIFRQLCEAVHYAHQRGVIHRDLKPSNVIVSEGDDGPAVKILDFGLARITESDIAATQITEIGVIKGTLAYMAPEQARGDGGGIDVRTDVYALGVLLYELLTKRRPYSVDTGSLLSAVRVICEESPQPLAQGWSAAVRLDPDLATIVGVALEKEPDLRFGSAAALGDDIGRLLASQPIQARAPSTIYQLRKLVARRKPVFATAAAALLLLIVATIGMSALYLRAERNLARAEAAEASARTEAQTAQRSSEFLVELFDQANPERNLGESISAREVMDAGARRVEDELADEPLVQARLMRTLGQVYLSLGLYDRSRPLLERALALHEEHLPAGDAEIAASVYEEARLLDEMGDFEAASAAFERAIALYEALGPAGVDGLIDANAQLSFMLGAHGDFEPALQASDRAMQLALARQPRDDNRIVGLLNNRGANFTTMGQLDSSLATLQRGLALAKRVHGDVHHQIGDMYTNLSVAESRSGNSAVAAEHNLQALAIYRAIFGEEHPKVAKALGNAGVFLAEQGNFAESMDYFEQSLAAMIAIHGPEHPEVARGHMNLGLAHMQMGDLPRATTELERAVALHEQFSPEGSVSLSYSLYHLSSARAMAGELADSRRLLERVIAIDEQIYGPRSGEVADDLEGLVMLLRELGDGAAAQEAEARMNSIRAELGAAAGS